MHHPSCSNRGNRRIAVVCDWVPYPVRSGDNKRTAEMIEVLRSHGWHVHLVLTTPLTRKDAKRLCYANVDRLHAFFGGNVFAYLFRFAVRKVDGVLYHLKLPPLRDIVSWLLGRKRHLAVDLFSRLPTYKPGFKEFLAKLAVKYEWEAVVVNYQWLHPAIEDLPDSVLALLDTIDLQHKRVEQFESSGLTGVHAITREEEADAMRGFDAIIAIQEAEAAEIRDMCPDKPIITLGSASPPPPERHVEELANRLLYVGGANGANIDGLRRFLDNCWPAIRQTCPEAQLRVCGYIYQAFLGDQREGVTFLGHVDDIELEYAEAALLINPIWVGTGLKIKTVEALARGKALVTTSKGVEGMRGNPDLACAIADSDEAFVSRVLAFLASNDSRTTLGAAAGEYAKQYLSIEAVYEEFLSFLDSHASGEPPKSLT
ncbi:MAG: glycosyltransferase family 4 protein [Verrucomicrobia bacterium]|jgi:glycosyltransferase involved in cell wall biosynthesis|nr:glycosyltransferase family 4 protein [Verrucomicrobiota bacterium]